MASRKGSVRKAADDSNSGWTCRMCSAVYSDDKSELLECEFCENHFCRKCLTLSGAEYKLLTKRSDLHWYCPPCEEKAIKNLKIEREVESRCKDYCAKIESRLDKIESTLDRKADTTQVKEMIEEHSKKEAAEGGAGDYEQIDQKISEFRESNARKTNIIIHNAPESEAVELETKKEDDLRLLEEICDCWEADSKTIREVTRLGKKNMSNEGVKKGRPLRVSFGDEREKSQFMKGLKKLANAEEHLKKLSIVHDMTLKERQQNKELVSEAKEMNEKNDLGDMKYIVAGPPWERKLVKVKMRK